MFVQFFDYYDRLHIVGISSIQRSFKLQDDKYELWLIADAFSPIHINSNTKDKVLGLLEVKTI